MPFAIVRNDVVLKADSDVAGPPESEGRSPAFPQEILDCIVDELHEDPNELKACCLAHRLLLDRGRAVLHRRVSITSYEHFRDKYSNPEVARHVTSLMLSQVGNLKTTGNLPFTILSRFPNVKWLTVRGTEWPERSSPLSRETYTRLYSRWLQP
ncbi:hypothetical protein BC629DRAFT_733895 [Irpex lacteus]|nr:hypothetical protein BC629DRAFT_733895 [Irpex lacteus]